MTKRIIGLLCLILLLFSINSNLMSVSAQIEIQHVLVINSYHQGYGWADMVMQGLLDTLIESDISLDIHVEYMDTKRYPTEALYEALIAIYDEKYDYSEIDLIVAADDNAMDFVLTYYDRFSDIPIVFSGLSYLEKYDFSDYPLTTGIVESPEYLENIYLIEKLQPEIEQIVLVADATETAQTGVLSFRKAVGEYEGDLEFKEIWNLPTDELLMNIESLDENTAILLIPYQRDADAQFIEYKSFVDLLVQRSKLPIYTAYSFQVIDHVIGGRVIDGVEHGRKAAQICLSILNGENPSQLLIEYDHNHGYLFNYEELQVRNISMRALPEGSKLMNEPTNIFYQFRKEIISLGILLVCLVGIIIALWFTVAKQRELENELQYMVSKDVLTGLNNRTAYYKKMEELRNESQEQRFPVGIIFMDINGLKNVNDTYGHRIGDEYIQMMADVLRRVSTPNDFLARIGGDEFVCILENVSQIDISQFLRNLNREMKRKAREIPDYVFSSSSGSSICYDQSNLIQSTHEADMAMYQEKKKNPNSTGRLPSIQT